MQFLKRLAGLSMIVLLGASAIFNAGCAPKAADSIVAKVGKVDVTLNEYENLYLKSSGSREQAAATTMEDRERFLDLMTKFKLKLMDAHASGLDKRPEIQNEIGQYKGSLVASYLTEREVNAPGLKKLYDARQVEVRASHILISLAPNAPAADSATAYSKAYDIIKQLRAGAKFESLAVANSSDPSVSQNKGDLYYFTAGRMVAEFEEAAFKLKPNEITASPVRTQYGLHIIKCTDRKASSGEVKASHIMIRFDKEQPTPEDTLAAYAKIQLIQDSLKAGLDFADLAKRNSGDPGSAPRGGDLGWFQRGRWIQPFDEEAFKLKPGQVSGIVRTIYGYHLIKSYETRPPKSFDDSKKELQQLFQQTRFQTEYNKFLDKVKAQTQYSIDEKVVDKFVVSFDSAKTTRDSLWWKTMPADVAKLSMMKFGLRTVSCDSIVSIINSRPDMASIPLNSGALRQQITKIAEQLVFQVKGETMEKEYPEFGSIMKEYSDGIMLYQIEQERVWGKVAVNDTALQKYFAANRDKFMWPDRVEFTSLSFFSDSLANLAYAKLKKGITLEQQASQDSARMKTPNNATVDFAKAKSALTASASKTLSAVGSDLNADQALRVQIVAYPDSSSRKKENEKLARMRLDAVRNFLVKKYGVDASRITAASRPQAKDTAAEKKAALAALINRLDVEIMNRRPAIIGSIENLLQPVTTDERSMKVDSLAAGSYSTPFNYHGNYTIVRLNKKDPLRQKTFEEAGTEVSSAFQEYESKRLEKEWIDSLRQRYPVVEYKEVLKNAFAPEK